MAVLRCSFRLMLPENLLSTHRSDLVPLLSRLLNCLGHLLKNSSLSFEELPQFLFMRLQDKRGVGCGVFAIDPW